MASPHVAGVMAVLAGQGNFTPKQLKAKVLEVASMNKVANRGRDSPNRLLYLPVTDEDSREDRVKMASDAMPVFRLQQAATA
jgi:hypothetical protein